MTTFSPSTSAKSRQRRSYAGPSSASKPTASTMKRSLSSSSSGDAIQVASAPSMGLTTPSAFAHTMRHYDDVYDRYEHDYSPTTRQAEPQDDCQDLEERDVLLVQITFNIKSSKDRLRKILSTKPVPTIFYQPTSAPPSTKTERAERADSPEDGPNHRGTYSKEYVLKHPEIKWSHRGQGRYLPSNEVNAASSIASPQPGRHGITRANNSDSVGHAADLESILQSLRRAFDNWWDNLTIYNQQAGRPSYHRTMIDSYANFMRENPREAWPLVLKQTDWEHKDTMEFWLEDIKTQFPLQNTHDNDGSESRIRTTRNSKAMPSIEQRRSSRLVDGPNTSTSNYREDDDEELAEASDTSSHPDKTYSKTYVDSHREEEFYHVGNGYYKRGSRPLKQNTDRRQSTLSERMRHESQVQAVLDPDTTIHKSDLVKYQGQEFHHAGNGWFKPGPPPSGSKRRSITVGADGQMVPFMTDRSSENGDDDDDDDDDDDADDDDDEEASEADSEPFEARDNETVDKAFTLLHPEISWTHRGNGRYKRKSTSEAQSVTPAASSDRRSSRAEYTSKDKSSEETSLRANARAKRYSHTAAEVDGTVLYDKAYTLAHPDEEFHHRGQGRYARGPRPNRPESSQDLEEADAEGLVDSAYTLAHPEETFHHRGQGKWARGLPPPGSSNKVAVRGPSNKDRNDTSSRVVEEEDEEGNRPPGMTTLVRRDEGPDRWPNLHWVYRGGGKWCRSSKEDLERPTRPPPPVTTKRLRNSLNRAGSDGPEAQIQREALLGATQPPPAQNRGRAAPAAAQPTPSANQSAPMSRRRALQRNASDLSERSERGDISRIARSAPPAPPKVQTPRPPLLSPEEDILTADDLPSLYKDAWSSDEDEDAVDQATKILRARYLPLVGTESFLKSLTKFDPAVRSLDTLKQLASNAQFALQQLQDEYLEIDKIVAQNPMHGKKERKPVKGGRQAVETVVFEDKKEAMLYDYTYDPRKIGYQNPDAQRIIRDAEGRELRRRRGRNQPDATHDPHVVNIFQDVEELTGRRVVKPVSRFDGLTTQPPRKRSRLAAAAALEAGVFSRSADTTPAPGEDFASLPPSRSATPANHDFRGGTAAERRLAALASAEEYKAPTRGRWKNHIPKRIRELRGESATSANRTGPEGSSTAKTAQKTEDEDDASDINDHVDGSEIGRSRTTAQDHDTSGGRTSRQGPAHKRQSRGKGRSMNSGADGSASEGQSTTRSIKREFPDTASVIAAESSIPVKTRRRGRIHNSSEDDDVMDIDRVDDYGDEAV